MLHLIAKQLGRLNTVLLEEPFRARLASIEA